MLSLVAFLDVAASAATATVRDQQTLAPTAATATAQCADELAASASAHAAAATALGIIDASYAVRENQPLWRQSVARTVMLPDNSTQRDTLYWIEPKSAHTTIVGHLMRGAAAFEGADARWDARHTAATTAALLQLGTKPTGVVDELVSNRPFEWTVVREPLGHFIAGFDEVEFFYNVSHTANLTLLRADPAGSESAWLASLNTGAPLVDRARAMLADML